MKLAPPTPSDGLADGERRLASLGIPLSRSTAAAQEEMGRLRRERQRSLRLLERLRHARCAVSTLDQGVSMIAHELRSPLTSLRLLIEDLLDRNEDGRHRAEIARLQHIITGMAATLDGLLDTVRLRHTSLDWREVDLSLCCHEAIELVSPQLCTGMRIILDADVFSSQLRGDAESLRRLVVNLLSNAARHATSGHITIAVRSALPGSLVLTVADCGEGIDGAVLSRLGQPFAGGSGPTGGSGLGLWICRTIAAMHGGHLCISSGHGLGTTVQCNLRARLDAPMRSHVPPPICIVPLAPEMGVA